MSGGKEVSNPAEAMARLVRVALGGHNNDDLPVTQLVQQLATDYAAAIARAEAAERDAARWRWLREHFRFANDSLRELWFDTSLEPNDSGVPADLDQELDAAIAAQQNNKT